MARVTTGTDVGSDMRRSDIGQRQSDDAAWPDDDRNETPTERLDRNWGDLLQELRVVQTGVQLLTGFLLTLPFQARFEKLTPFQQNVYLSTVGISIISSALLIAPVSVHRLLFRRHARKIMVAVAHRLALAGIGFLGLAITGVVLLTFDVVRNATVGFAMAALTALLLLSLWLATPIGLRTRVQRDANVNVPAGPAGRPPGKTTRSWTRQS